MAGGLRIQMRRAVIQNRKCTLGDDARVTPLAGLYGMCASHLHSRIASTEQHSPDGPPFQQYSSIHRRVPPPEVRDHSCPLRTSSRRLLVTQSDWYSEPAFGGVRIHECLGDVWTSSDRQNTPGAVSRSLNGCFIHIPRQRHCGFLAIARRVCALSH